MLSSSYTPKSLFAKLFISVFLALIVFGVALVIWIQIAHNNSDSFNNRVVARQIATQLDPFLSQVNKHAQAGNLLQTRFGLVVIKKSLDIFDESLNAKIGIYDKNKILVLQTNNSNLPSKIVRENSWVTDALPILLDYGTPHIQVKTSQGYTLWYEKRNPKPPSAFSAFFNIFTGLLLLILIMSIALWWLSKSMTYRINQLSQQIGAFGDGDFSVRVHESGNDEISVLARGFNQSAQKIEQLISANQLLLAHASHEFRTPITRIRLQIEMMQMLAQGLDDDNCKKFSKRANAVNKDLTGLNDLIESILLVSRLDAGHSLENKQTVNLYELIFDECEHYDDTTFIGEPTFIKVQPKLLTHLIRNLLNNAFVHGKPPVRVYLYGCITSDETTQIPQRLLLQTDTQNLDDIQTDNLKPTNEQTDNFSPTKELSKEKHKFLTKFFSQKPASYPPKFAVIAVIDEGSGIPADKAEDIFSPFVRLKQEKKGSGLGLSLVSQIVDMHHGTVKTDTWQGKTRFLVVLPINNQI